VLVGSVKLISLMENISYINVSRKNIMKINSAFYLIIIHLKYYCFNLYL
jgi:hypothetical protein